MSDFSIAQNSSRRTTNPESSPPEDAPIDLITWFGADGLLAQHTPGYENRPGQLRMAEAVDAAIACGTDAVIEGATGVGKTFAVLIAAISRGQRLVYATETKILQDQLKDKDLPFLWNISPVPFTFTTVKGRDNYVCLREFQQACADSQEDADLFATPDDAKLWQQVIEWVSAEEREGGIAEVDESGLPTTPTLKRLITIDSHRCLGRECTLFERCFAERAKQQAKQAQIIIINQHLLLFDSLLDELTEGKAALFSDRPVAVIDEAHTLADVARRVFGVDVGIGRFFWLGAELKRLRASTDAKAPKNVTELIRQLEKEGKEKSTPLDEAIDAAVTAMTVAIEAAKSQFNAWVYTMGGRQWMNVPVDDVQLLVIDLQDVLTELQQVMTAAKKAELYADILLRWRSLANATEHLADDLRRTMEPSPNVVRYLEKSEGKTPRVSIKVVPIDVAQRLRTHVWAKCSTTIAISATLRTGGNFDYWKELVGCDKATPTLVIPSPFNYPRRARLFLPEPPRQYDPSTPGQDNQAAYHERMGRLLVELLQASRGRALVLCTSMGAAIRWAEHIRAQGMWKVLVQGESAKRELLDAFRANISSVLFATKSFWQGVDVAGESLSLLVIDNTIFL